uniref:Uncharacterized protein n=1 Tax=Corethron hystrix TaxID=216773 RepID=A0A6U5EZJ9_9STRA|eukprot:CAMPEP_0113302338 /NCGR_PEP_ID=MMETSP0010_2-20120614/3187_1 /TAXON_ID=216773 ORGANISM="Corethron hystrix, Strain 308" /NCGR_SAMPLE_ID=MMETSP0010_2 /ASSEMBLY_ACC=CAM_ASM_000155 /LENGTH=113 /DNA_ID=CAMNT_0000156101 /DNA_START=285 /DNA_END=626 /DNA_ORIENTATION=+ /assembly_acc=CAM_ASM_000155
MKRIVLIRGIPQPPANRHDRERNRDRKHSQHDAPGDDGLLVDQLLEPALPHAAAGDLTETREGAQNENDVTVDAHDRLREGRRRKTGVKEEGDEDGKGRREGEGRRSVFLDNS